jgi:hypothetical protein
LTFGDFVARRVKAPPKDSVHFHRECAWLIAAMAVWAVAIFAGWLHLTHGPLTQRIHVRWASNVSAAERSQLEQRAGLRAGVERELRTWSYLLEDRSRDNIARLISDPRVEDTFHIDREAFRVQLDRPDLDARVRWLLETDTLPAVAVALALVAALSTWWSRGALVRLGAATRRIAGGLVRLLRATLTIAVVEGTAERPRPGRWEMTAGITFGVLLLVPLLVYGPYEEEIVSATIMPNQVFYRELFRGDWLYWFNNLGFGTPMPLGDPLMFHPVFAPLAAFTSLRTTFSAVWIAHTVVMVVYFLRLTALSGVGMPGLRLVLLACYLWSIPFTFYFYGSDWIQMAITWSLYPVMLFYLRSAILGGARESFWPTTLRLAALFGFWVINAHPGYIVPLGLVLAVYAIVTAPMDSRVYLCLGVSGALCTAIAAARIYTLMYELRLFPPGGGIRDGTHLSAYVGAFVAPLVQIGGRGPFIGLGLGIAIVVLFRRFSQVRDAHVRGCAIACIAAAAFNLAPPAVVNRILPALGTWLFADPMIFFALLAGGSVMQWAVRSPRQRYRRAAALLIVLQVVQQGAAIMWPNFVSLLAHRGDLLFYQYQGQAVGLGRVLVDNGRRFGPRLYLSREVEKVMRRRLSADGVHFPSDLVLLGLNPVNGWFKNVSMAALYPPWSLMESLILGDVNVIHNGTLLDVLGINMVLSTERESGIPPGLIVADRPRVQDSRLSDLVLLGNPDAWPQAVLMEPDAYRVALPVRAGCGHQAALCRDYAALARIRLAGDVALSASNGRYVAHFPAAQRERLLFISALYRPEWKATAARGALPVHVVAGAFLGVTVPPNVTDVTVAYVPRLQIALTWFSSVLFFSVAAAVCLRRRQRVATRVGAPESNLA